MHVNTEAVYTQLLCAPDENVKKEWYTNMLASKSQFGAVVNLKNSNLKNQV